MTADQPEPTHEQLEWLENLPPDPRPEWFESQKVGMVRFARARRDLLNDAQSKALAQFDGISPARVQDTIARVFGPAKASPAVHTYQDHVAAMERNRAATSKAIDKALAHRTAEP